MSYVSLEEAKRHLYVTHDQDDTLIQAYIDAAESYAASFMNRSSIDGPQECPWHVGPGCDDCSSEPASSEPGVPAGVKQAVMLLIGDYYNLREAQITGTILTANPAADALLHFHRVGLGV